VTSNGTPSIFAGKNAEHLVVQNTRTRTVDVAVMKRSLEDGGAMMGKHMP